VALLFDELDLCIKEPCTIGLRIAAEEEPKYEFYTSRLGIRANAAIPFFKERIKDYNNVFPIKGSSNQFFNNHEDEGNWWYDFIYIDADHTAAGVLDDAVMAWQHLKPGGIMAFDDYVWTHEKGSLYEPKSAIDFFCWAKQSELKIIDTNEQLWVQKNDN
jgi:hypothetical protein